MNDRDKEQKQGPKIHIHHLKVKGHEYTRHVLYLGRVDGKTCRKSFGTEAEARAEWDAHLLRRRVCLVAAGGLCYVPPLSPDALCQKWGKRGGNKTETLTGM